MRKPSERIYQIIDSKVEKILNESFLDPIQKRHEVWIQSIIQYLDEQYELSQTKKHTKRVIKKYAPTLKKLSRE